MGITCGQPSLSIDATLPADWLLRKSIIFCFDCISYFFTSCTTLLHTCQAVKSYAENDQTAAGALGQLIASLLDDAQGLTMFVVNSCPLTILENNISSQAVTYFKSH